jgi:hypothetical protein
MSWNLFERIINALRPGKESEQPSDTTEPWPPELQTVDDTSQSYPEGSTEPPEASEEPSPDFQEAVNPAHPSQLQD